MHNSDYKKERDLHYELTSFTPPMTPGSEITFKDSNEAQSIELPSESSTEESQKSSPLALDEFLPRPQVKTIYVCPESSKMKQKLDPRNILGKQSNSPLLDNSRSCGDMSHSVVAKKEEKPDVDFIQESSSENFISAVKSTLSTNVSQKFKPAAKKDFAKFDFNAISVKKKNLEATQTEAKPDINKDSKSSSDGVILLSPDNKSSIKNSSERNLERLLRKRKSSDVILEDVVTKDDLANLTENSSPEEQQSFEAWLNELTTSALTNA